MAKGRKGTRVQPISPLMVAIVIFSALPVSAADFDSTVAPLLVKRCLNCHNRSDRKGGLDLSSAKPALAGGDSGEVIAPGKLDDSLLWDRVSSNEMPPKKPLADDEKKIIREWIAGGAKWGTDPIDVFRYSSDNRAGYDWWSLKPVRRPELPVVKDNAWPITPVDHFLLAALEAKGLHPSSPADKRTLIRRLSADLIGLPPTPDEVSAFLADQSPDAYEKLVDRLLVSPHYGERWGRHWLDVVRFGESQGFERDKLRTTSWPYRDWVISAFNDDLPYDEFVRLQIAGDVFRPNDPKAVIATGFLVAAPWDEVGQTQQSAAMKAVVRQDELEDVIGVTAQTFLGLTANCARCHDHKFDPVTQTEYYRLSAALAGVKHGERDSLTEIGRIALTSRLGELQASIVSFERQVAEIDEPVRKKILAGTGVAAAPQPAPQPLARWEFDGDLKDSLGELHGAANGSAKVEAGKLLLDGKDAYVTTVPLKKGLKEKSFAAWLTLNRLDQRGGGAIGMQTLNGATFDAIVFGERDPGQWMAGSNGFVRTQSFSGPQETEADKTAVCFVLVYAADRTITAYRNGRPYGQSYTASDLQSFEPEKAQVVFGLRHAPPGENKLLAAAIERAALFDRALTAEEVAALAGTSANVVTEDRILANLSPEEWSRRTTLKFELSRLRSELRLISGGKVYAVSPVATPATTHLLDRGSTTAPRDVVTAGGIKSLGLSTADFALPDGAPDVERRRKLAAWITDPKNPLTARVLANRLWHYHFGTGIVDTPNDFGFNGGRPSHPELLDWLASELTSPTSNDGAVRAWSIKRLHRLIVLSAAYRQSSRFDERAAKIDAGNRLLWRMSPRRLEAEAVRDAILFVSGELNTTMGGPGFQDFRTFTFNSQFYEPLDPIGYGFQRRTVYRTWVRSGRNEFLDVFDCPDPSATSPRRAVTTTPLQALALLNNSFTLRMSDRFADRARREAGDDVARQVARVYEFTYTRPPTGDEQIAGEKFAAAHGLSALCRVVFNSNEFLYVD